MAIDPSKLKPSDVTRLLNSTSLGTVIDDRQLYRHRQRDVGNEHAGADRVTRVAEQIEHCDHRRSMQRTRRTEDRRGHESAERVHAGDEPHAVRDFVHRHADEVELVRVDSVARIEVEAR